MGSSGRLSATAWARSTTRLFELLRKQARSSNKRVVDLARAVAESLPLLPKDGALEAAD